MNKLTIIGNLTRDPESKTTQDGKTVCNFTVAVNRSKRDENGKSQADFFRVTAWERIAESCQKYLTKGRKVCVVGSVSVYAYNGNDGTAKASLEVRASEVEFLSPAGEGGADNYSQPPAAQAPAPEAAPAPDGFVQTQSDDLPF